MENEHAEIVASLAACDVMSEFDTLLVTSWNKRRQAAVPLSDVGTRHIYRLLYRYREYVTETYLKYENHPKVIEFREQEVAT